MIITNTVTTPDGYKFEILRRRADSYWVIQTDKGATINTWEFPSYFDARMLVKEITGRGDSQ